MRAFGHCAYNGGRTDPALRGLRLQTLRCSGLHSASLAGALAVAAYNPAAATTRQKLEQNLAEQLPEQNPEEQTKICGGAQQQ